MKFRNSLVATLLSPSNIRNTCLTIMIFTGVLNYMLLMYNHKSEKIIEFFHEKFKIEKQNKTQVVLIITYNILSIIAGIYLSYLIGINKIQALIGPSKIL
jgi:phosphate/sulfate permease